MLLFAALPVVDVTSSVMGMSAGQVSLSGGHLCGWSAWLALLAFAAAAASRALASMTPYRRTLDMLAFAMLLVVLVYSFLGSPVATAARPVSQAQVQVGNLVGGDLGRNLGGSAGSPRSLVPPVSLSVLPDVGAVFFLLLPVFLVLARRRERTLAAPV